MTVNPDEGHTGLDPMQERRQELEDAAKED